MARLLLIILGYVHSNPDKKYTVSRMSGFMSDRGLSDIALTILVLHVPMHLFKHSFSHLFVSC